MDSPIVFTAPSSTCYTRFMSHWTQDVRFPGFFGEMMAGRIDKPMGAEPKAYALFAHCFTGSKDFKGTVNICKALAANGIAVMRFDFHGLGESEGEFGEATFSSNVSDIVCAGQYMASIGHAPTILIGHSLGGAAALVAAHQLDSVKLMATIGAPYHPAHAEHLFEHYMEDIYYRGEAMVDIKGRRFRMEGKFLDDLQQQTPDVVISTLGRPLVVFHCREDELVEFDNAEKIIAAAMEPKKLIELKGIDHLVRDENNATIIGEGIAAELEQLKG
jgi:esterase/lipase